MRSDLERIHDAALAEFRRERVAVEWTREALRALLLIVGVSLPVMAIAWWLPAHPHLGELWWSIAAALVGVVVLGGAVLSLSPGRPAGRWLVVGAALASVPALVAALSGTPVDAAWSSPECILSELGLAFLPAVFLTRALSRFAWQPMRALVAGLASAATGVLTLHVICPTTAPGHVLLFHVSPGLVVAVLVIWARARVRSQSFAP